MTNCVKCGHELGVGRYCINCGHPVDRPVDRPADHVDAEWRTDTAERPLAPAAAPTTQQEPPPAWTPPPPARFPLFADEVDDEPDHLDSPPPGGPSRHRRQRPWAAWLVVAAVLVLVAVLGVALLTSGDDPESARPPATPDPTTGATSESPSPSEEDPSSSAPPSTAAGEVAGDAAVQVPATAPPGTDVSGKPVDFKAENMVDGEAETAWRMAGDGTGKTISITLPQKTSLTTVGLINGYAKKDRGRDWYHGNRRIQRVEWVFDDGTSVAQQLGDSTRIQTIAVDTTTTKVQLRLVAVSAPGTGAAKRDNTAISELSLIAG